MLFAPAELNPYDWWWIKTFNAWQERYWQADYNAWAEDQRAKPPSYWEAIKKYRAAIEKS